jgi:hypothetical protein
MNNWLNEFDLKNHILSDNTGYNVVINTKPYAIFTEDLTKNEPSIKDALTFKRVYSRRGFVARYIFKTDPSVHFPPLPIRSRF